MSSHHIVRDEQEPAIVIAEMKKEYWSVIQQLLGWVPTVIVDEKYIDEVLLRGIKIDVVLCQEDNMPSLTKQLHDQQPIKFITKLEKDLVSTAINHLKEKGYKGVNIFGEFDIEKSVSFNDQITTIWYDENYRYVLSNKHKFQKWMIKDHGFCLLPVKEQQSFELVNADNKVHETTYTCAQSGKVLVSSNADFWIGEKLK